MTETKFPARHDTRSAGPSRGPTTGRPEERPTGSLPTGSLAESRAALSATLDSARLLARTGQDAAARELCAAGIFLHQPLLANDPDLLRHTFAVLIRARGFHLLTRLAHATLGRDIQVRIAADLAPSLPPLARAVRHGRTIYLIDPVRLIADDTLIRRWTEELVPDPALPPSLALA